MQSVVAPTESGLALAVRGRGPDVVLIHGSLGDYRQWNAIAERLEPNYRVIAVSRRHHWPNPPPQPDISYTYEGHSADLQLFLHSIGHPAHVVGHSYGAGVALLAASMVANRYGVSRSSNRRLVVCYRRQHRS